MFLKEIISSKNIVQLPVKELKRVRIFSEKYGLDFDDAYQCSISDYFNLRIVTMDSDFKNVEKIEVILL